MKYRRNKQLKKKHLLRLPFSTSWIHRRMKAMDLVLSCLLLSAVTGLGEMYGKKVTVSLL